jgi:hypothetical protein
VTGTYLATDSATAVQYSQVFQTTDNGKTWAAMGTPIDPTFLVTTIDVTKTEPQRIYVSGTRGLGSDRTASLLVSSDGGKTWIEKPIPQFNPNQELSIYIGAIDPTNADRVYLRSSGLKTGGQSRVYFTSNGGADAATTFSMSGSLPDEGGFDVEEAGMFDITGELLGFALSPDGSTIYIGTIESGLWVANTSDMVFTQKNANVRVKCLATRNHELWACSDITSGFVVGESLDDGASFTPKMKYVTSLCGPIDCAPNPGGPLGCGATDNGASCVSAYETFCANDDQGHVCGSCGGDGGAPDDAGTPEGGPVDAGRGADAGPTGTPSVSSSCGCSVVGGRGATGLAAGLALAAITLRRRQSSRRRRR